jgi:hypothetical protein
MRLRWNYAVLTLIACGHYGSGANDAVIMPPAEVTLPLGATRAVGDVAISFVKVSEDSRCPVNVQCVWAGNAAVELSLASGSRPVVSRVLNSGIEPKTVDEFGLRITLKELSPVPRQGAADTTTPAVVLHVEKP